MMISYVLYKKDISARMKIICKVLFGQIYICDLICLVLGIYLTFFGFTFNDENSKINGISFLCLVAVHIIIILNTLRTIKKKLEQNFNEYSEDGSLHYAFCYENSKCTVKCYESRKETVFTKNEIKKVIFKDNTIIILLKSKVSKPKVFIDMPYNDVIYKELNS